MTQEPLPENVLGNFDDVTLTFDGLECRLLRTGDRFYMNLIDPIWESSVVESGGTPGEIPDAPRVTYSVDRLVGSHTMQVYLTKFPNGEYWSLPLVWHQGERRWVTQAGTFLSSPSEKLYSYTTPWNNDCAYCHNTKARPGLLVDPQAPLERYAFQTKLEEMGIACEACHGPGERHVRANRNPLRRAVLQETQRSDPTIVNPAKLSKEASAQVCGRCHGKWRAKEELLADWFTTGDFFVPGGEPLATHYRFGFSFPSLDGDDAQPQTGYFWPEWTPQTTALEWQGLELSPCFERGELTCVSCHRMHGSDPEDQLIFPDDEEAPATAHNAACVSCHEQFSDPENRSSHTHHSSESSGSRCFNCHMPYQAYGLLKAIRSHRILSPSAATTARTGLPNACNQCHIDQPLQWTAGWLSRWYGHEVPRLSPDQQELSATVVDMFQGHALSRALAVSRLGSSAAHEAAPGQWPVPLLTRALDDSYAAVRFIAHRSLRAIPGFETADFDYIADRPRRLEQIDAILDRWRLIPEKGLPEETARLLLDRRGELNEEGIDRLLKKQDQTEYEVFE